MSSFETRFVVSTVTKLCSDAVSFSVMKFTTIKDAARQALNMIWDLERHMKLDIIKTLKIMHLI